MWQRAREMDADDFRGMENELMMCEGARVLLTQNLWVEAGLMNGAMGVLRGYMWPKGGDPHSDDPSLRSPLCLFVEFDSVDPRDEKGNPRSFFPGDPVRKNWVPIYPQRVASTAEDHLARENFPLTLAWALTHWKAQGMTLEKVIVSLSHACSKPGVLFVALTRVRHPDNLLLEDDFPAFSMIRRQLSHPNFIARQKWERRMLVLFSLTVRRRMRSEEWFADDVRWDANMSSMADYILRHWGSHTELEGDAFLDRLLRGIP